MHDFLESIHHIIVIEHESDTAELAVRKALLVSVRSGVLVSMPGMMDALLNNGLCDATAPRPLH